MSPARAPTVCLECTTLVYDGSGRCHQHQRRSGKWDSKKGRTNRTATSEHKKRRKRILKRDPLCKLAYEGICTRISTICDHIIPLGAAQLVGATVAQLDTDDYCRGVCRPCSDRVTSLAGHYIAGHNVECPWPTEGAATEGRGAVRPSDDRRDGHRDDRTAPALPRSIIARY
jgi:hypothetical protein